MGVVASFIGSLSYSLVLSFLAIYSYGIAAAWRHLLLCHERGVSALPRRGCVVSWVGWHYARECVGVAYVYCVHCGGGGGMRREGSGLRGTTEEGMRGGVVVHVIEWPALKEQEQFVMAH